MKPHPLKTIYSCHKHYSLVPRPYTSCLVWKFWWMSSLLLNCSKNQWDWEIVNYYTALPLQQWKFASLLRYPNIFEWVWHKMFWTLLGYISYKCTHQPWKFHQTVFFLVRGWGLGMRLVVWEQDYQCTTLVSHYLHTKSSLIPRPSVWDTLVLVPDPKPTPAWITFSFPHVTLEGIYAPDDVWGQD